MDTARLDRIEKKIDESGVQLARIEERLIASTDRVDRHEFRLDEQETELDSLRNAVVGNSHFVKTGERFMWIVVAALISFIAFSLRY